MKNVSFVDMGSYAKNLNQLKHMLK